MLRVLLTDVDFVAATASSVKRRVAMDPDRTLPAAGAPEGWLFGGDLLSRSPVRLEVDAVPESDVRGDGQI